MTQDRQRLLHRLRPWLQGIALVFGLDVSSVAAPAQSSAAGPVQEAASEQVPAKLTCGAHSANPNQLKSFQIDLTFNVFDSLWVVDRTTSPQPGTEKFRGILSPTGTMLIAGRGKADDGAVWSYELSGKKKPSGITILRGSLNSDSPKGTRTCSLTFYSATP